jgi:hypothetical protein
MPARIPVDLTQTENNKLTSISTQERATLIPINDYKTTNQYTATNADALATGDEQGKGTGGFLDVYNPLAGNNIDNDERKLAIARNLYSRSKTYPDF